MSVPEAASGPLPEQSGSTLQRIQVALDLPLHRLFDYLATATPEDIGLRVRVPFGKGERVGIILGVGGESAYASEQLKEALEILRELPPLPESFLKLCEFAAAYYQAPLGETLLAALPGGLKKTRITKRRAFKSPSCEGEAELSPPLTACQSEALSGVVLGAGFRANLIYGVTGSGKTEVYLRLVAEVLARGGQVLILVPEINLTPQLEERVSRRFPQARTVSLHSELAEAARERNWISAFQGEADIVLGTRLAVFTPMPRLRLLIVDEEHDASFKQQDGMRYSARDVAVFRAHREQLPIVLGSATPALESWANAGSGRYGLLRMEERASANARLPTIRLVDTRRYGTTEGLSEPVLAALKENLRKGEQSLVFLNRRGYAPVLSCPSCGWVARCKRCTANLVVHRADHRLRCHHCGFETRLPRACPTCGNQDMKPLGRGTQRLEDWLKDQFPEARVLRVDRDSARSRKQWEAMLLKIKGGEADILVGTQMLAKGHDFPRLTLVAVTGADAALFSADCRAPERLFAQLMQVSGRAGRAALPGEVLIQTQYPDHPLYGALVAQDYPGYAASLLEERQQAGFPPYGYQAMLRAEAPLLADAQAFLQQAAELPWLGEHAAVTLYDPVPMRMTRLASLERAQLLVESPSRPALQAFLPRWREALEDIKAPSRLRWHIEVDPLDY